MKKAIVIAMIGVMSLSSCYSTGQGAYTGAYFGSIMGSAMGGILGGRTGRDVGTLVGMATGTAVGAAAGAKSEEARYEKMQRRRERMMERKRQREEARRRSYHQQDEMYTYGRSRNGFTLEKGKAPEYVAPNNKGNNTSDKENNSGFTNEPTYDDRIEIK